MNFFPILEIWPPKHYQIFCKFFSKIHFRLVWRRQALSMICVHSLVDKCHLIAQLATIWEQAEGWRDCDPPNIPTVKKSFWQYLANSPDEIEQAEWNLSILRCRGIQGQNTLRTAFWISFLGRSYTHAKSTYFSKIQNFGDFGQVWLAISRPLWKMPRYNYDER